MFTKQLVFVFLKRAGSLPIHLASVAATTGCYLFAVKKRVIRVSIAFNEDERILVHDTKLSDSFNNDSW